MKTYKEFLDESRLRQLTLGPSSSPFGRARQQKDASERAAFRRAGMTRSRRGTSSERRPNKISFNAIPGEYTSTAITSYPNQSSYARDIMPAKVDDKTKRVIPTAKRALFLRRLKRQTGDRSSRGVHAVDVLPKKDFNKNDPNKLITRGKEYHSTVENIPKNIKQTSGGNPGDIFTGKAAEVMSGSKDMEAGRRKREKFYSKVLGASGRDPITNVQAARVKE